MLEWKIGKKNLEGYLLKIICDTNVKTFSTNISEKAYKLVLYKKGSSVLKVNGKTIAITAPCIFAVSDKDDIQCMNENNELDMNIIYFHPSVINHLFDCCNVQTGEFHVEWQVSINQDRYLLIPFFERKVPYGGILPVDVNTFNRTLQLFDKLQKQMEAEADGFWPCRSRSFLIELLIILQMRYVDDSAPKEFLELNDTEKEMDDVLDFIHSNYPSKITIDLLTKQFNMNRNALNQRFMELTGYTPISYLIQHRLKVAESLLVNTGIPVYEICERVGFGELSNFMKSFKKKYGLTPANYRSLYTTMECA